MLIKYCLFGGHKKTFIKLEPLEVSDKTKSIELNFRKCLSKLLEDNLLQGDFYRIIAPLGLCHSVYKGNLKPVR